MELAVPMSTVGINIKLENIHKIFQPSINT